MVSARDTLAILRPRHWTKNVFVFAALVFGRKLAGPSHVAWTAVGEALTAFAAFCLASSAGYILNDLLDRSMDRSHPDKAGRPIAAGRVSALHAAAVMACLVAGALGLSLIRGGWLVWVVGLYMLLMACYCLGVKQVMILDCIVIAVGFCLRAVAGAVAIDVFISPWLVVCTFALCLFMAFGKRQAELLQLGKRAEACRQTLAGYTPELLAHMLDVTSGLAVVCFLLYSMDTRTAALFGTHALVYTTPAVLYGVFRFSAQIQGGLVKDPVEFILRDRPFQVAVAVWVGACAVIIYHRPLGAFLGVGQ